MSAMQPSTSLPFGGLMSTLERLSTMLAESSEKLPDSFISLGEKARTLLETCKQDPSSFDVVKLEHQAGNLFEGTETLGSENEEDTRSIIERCAEDSYVLGEEGKSGPFDPFVDKMLDADDQYHVIIEAARLREENQAQAARAVNQFGKRRLSEGDGNGDIKMEDEDAANQQPCTSRMRKRRILPVRRL